MSSSNRPHHFSHTALHPFADSVVGFRGTDDIAFDAAITAILIEGIIFLVLAVTGARQYIAKFIVSALTECRGLCLFECMNLIASIIFTNALSRSFPIPA